MPDNRELLLRALNVLAGRLSATGSCSQVAFNSIVRYCSLSLSSHPPLNYAHGMCWLSFFLENIYKYFTDHRLTVDLAHLLYSVYVITIVTAIVIIVVITMLLMMMMMIMIMMIPVLLAQNATNVLSQQ